jgi:hypothetical protein
VLAFAEIPPPTELLFRAGIPYPILTRLPNGDTRLEGTAWYRDALWPGAYWRVWLDYIIHKSIFEYSNISVSE